MADDENTRGRGRGRPSRRGVKLPKRSSIWQHFEETDCNDGSVKCKYCFQVFGRKSQGGNLNRHYERQCSARPPAAAAAAAPPGAPALDRDPVREQEAADMEVDEQAVAIVRTPLPLPSPTPPCGPSSGSGGSRDREPVLEQEEACRDLARMIALGGHDPSILEDADFKNFVRRLNPAFQVPSRHDIEKMCDIILDGERAGLSSKTWEMTGHLSMAVGKATTVQGEVMYAACHFIDDDWDLHRVVTGWAYVVNLAGLNELHDEVYKFILDSIDGSMNICDGQRIFMIAYGVSSDPWINNLIKDKITGEYLDALLNPELFCTSCMDNVLHSIARCLSSVPQLPDIYKRVRDHDMTRQEREELLSYCGLDNLWAYDEPWYSCYCSLEVLRTRASSTPTYIEHMLCKLWGAIYRAIRTISASSNPTSHLCLRELFNVWQALQSEQEAAPNDGRTEGVIRKAKHTLDKALRDYCLVWSIPRVMDPRYKLESMELIFERVFGPDYYIYCHEVKENIKQLCSSYSSDEDEDFGDNADLDDYLEDDLVPDTDGFDILNWWKFVGSDRYPRVARMARDALAMPTCSKLSSEQLAQVRSRLCGYSTLPFLGYPHQLLLKKRFAGLDYQKSC